MTTMKTLTLMLGLAFLCASCSGTRYLNAPEEEVITADFGLTDRQRFVKGVVDDLLASPALSYVSNAPDESGDARLLAVMGGITNRTSERVDMRGIADGVLNGLLGRMRFVAGQQGKDERGGRLRFELSGGRVDPANAAAFGKQLGAQVILYGSLASIEQTKGRWLENLGSNKRDVYYRFVMQCVNTKTAELVWTHEVELHQQQVTSLFGSS